MPNKTPPLIFLRPQQLEIHQDKLFNSSHFADFKYKLGGYYAV